jgi:ABC-type multidrug transport system fused ATPase/permease subunit
MRISRPPPKTPSPGGDVRLEQTQDLLAGAGSLPHAPDVDRAQHDAMLRSMKHERDRVQVSLEHLRREHVALKNEIEMMITEQQQMKEDADDFKEILAGVARPSVPVSPDDAIDVNRIRSAIARSWVKARVMHVRATRMWWQANFFNFFISLVMLGMATGNLVMEEDFLWEKVSNTPVGRSMPLVINLGMPLIAFVVFQVKKRWHIERRRRDAKDLRARYQFMANTLEHQMINKFDLHNDELWSEYVNLVCETPILTKREQDEAARWLIFNRHDSVVRRTATLQTPTQTYNAEASRIEGSDFIKINEQANGVLDRSVSGLAGPSFEAISGFMTLLGGPDDYNRPSRLERARRSFRYGRSSKT